VGFWDQVWYTSETLLEHFVGWIHDALGYTRTSAYIESRDVEAARVVSALISGDELIDLLVPRFNRLGTFRVESFVPLSLHELNYTILASIPD